MKEEITPEQSPQSRKPIALYIAGALAAIIIIALVVALLSSRQKTVVLAPAAAPPPGTALTQAPMPQSPGGQAVTQAPAPALAPSGQPVQPPPQDVLDYLNDVSKIEQHRKYLLNDKGPALALLAGGGDALESMIRQAMDPDLNENVDPFSKVRSELSRQLKHWQNVIRSFDTLKPPPSCMQFAGAYRWVLTTETQQIGKATAILADANADNEDTMSRALSALNNMKADPNTQGGIGKAVDASETQLNSVCKQFGITKPFSVYKETSGGSIIMP